MRPLTEVKMTTYIPAAKHDSNEIPMAIPMFSRSGYTTKLLGRPLDVWISELKMSSVNQKLLSAIFDSLHLHTSSNFRSSLVFLPDPGNMSTAIGNWLLSRIQAEICVMSYPLPEVPVTGRHLQFLTNSPVG